MALNTTSIYVLRGGAHIKVGVSYDPEKRRRDIQNGNPHPVELLSRAPVLYADAHRLERAVHTELAEHRAQGEWFAVDAVRRHAATSLDPSEEARELAARCDTILERYEGARARERELASKLDGAYQTMYDARRDAHTAYNYLCDLVTELAMLTGPEHLPDDLAPYRKPSLPEPTPPRQPEPSRDREEQRGTRGLSTIHHLATGAMSESGRLALRHANVPKDVLDEYLICALRATRIFEQTPA